MQQEQGNLLANQTHATQSRSGELLRVKLSDIVARKAWQVRAKINPATVKQYLTAYRADESALPPIRVANVKGTLLLVDGWHRLEALKLNGCNDALAVVFKATEEEAQWEAAKANLTHGLPLKPREVRNVFRAYVRSKQHRLKRSGFKSYRQIAADLAQRVGHTTIRNWMRSDFPSVFKALGAYHDEEKMNWSNNGPSSTPRLSPLEIAIGNLEAALNEARSMCPEERKELAVYALKIVKKIEAVKPWDASEAAPETDNNEDF